MSIIEDADKLTKQGRQLCTLLFIGGVCGVIAITLKISNLPSVLKNAYAETAARTSLESRPEEIVREWPAGPKTAEAVAKRKQEMLASVQGWQETLESVGASTSSPRETIEVAKEKGMIHPEDAKHYKDVLGLE